MGLLDSTTPLLYNRICLVHHIKITLRPPNHSRQQGIYPYFNLAAVRTAYSFQINRIFFANSTSSFHISAPLLKPE
jgi:hypothetical protein